MNNQEVVRILAKPLAWVNDLMNGLIILIGSIVILNNWLPAKVLFLGTFTGFMSNLLIQSYVNRCLAQKILRLDEKIEELERRIP